MFVGGRVGGVRWAVCLVCTCVYMYIFLAPTGLGSRIALRGMPPTRKGCFAATCHTARWLGPEPHSFFCVGQIIPTCLTRRLIYAKMCKLYGKGTCLSRAACHQGPQLLKIVILRHLAGSWPPRDAGNRSNLDVNSFIVHSSSWLAFVQSSWHLLAISGIG